MEITNSSMHSFVCSILKYVLYCKTDGITFVNRHRTELCMLVQASVISQNCILYSFLDLQFIESLKLFHWSHGSTSMHTLSEVVVVVVDAS